MDEEDKILKEAFDKFIEDITYKFDYMLQKEGTFGEYNKDLEKLELEITKDMTKEENDLFLRYREMFVDLQVRSNTEFLKIGMKSVLKNLG